MIAQPYVIRETAYRQLCDWTKAHRYVELGGMLLGVGRYIYDVNLLPNIHPAPGGAYQADPLDVKAARRHAASLGLRIVGYWHSHPDGPAIPSDADKAQHRTLELIWDTTYARPRLWHLGKIDDGELPLVVGSEP